jgi:hypothetical protein
MSVRHPIFVTAVLGLLVTAFWVLAKEKDTPKAAETRKKLQEKISVDYQDEPIRNVAEDLKSKVKGLGVKIDSTGGVSGNIKITYKGDDETLEKVLAGMFKKNGLGYIVVSKAGNAYDGTLLIKQGKERGYPVGEEPDQTAAKDDEEKDKTAAKGKDKAKAKPKKKTEEKTAAKEKPEDDPDKDEKDAARKLNFAKTLAEDGKTAKAKERLEEVITKYPKTKAAEEARELLKNLDK